MREIAKMEVTTETDNTHNTDRTEGTKSTVNGSADVATVDPFHGAPNCSNKVAYRDR